MINKICDRIEASLKRALGKEFPSNFECIESDGVIRISGVVASPDALTVSGITARIVVGGRQLDNRIQVVAQR